MLGREVDRLTRKQLRSTASAKSGFNSIGIDRHSAPQCHQRRFGLVWRLRSKLFGDFAATLDQLALPQTIRRVIAYGIEQRCGIGKKVAKLVDHQSFQIAGGYPATEDARSRPWPGKAC